MPRDGLDDAKVAVTLERPLLERIAVGAPLGQVLAEICAGAEALLPGTVVCLDAPGCAAAVELAPAVRAAGLTTSLSLPIPDEPGAPRALGTLSAHHHAAGVPHARSDRERQVLARCARLAGIAMARRRLEARLLTEHQLATIGSFAAGIAHDVNNPLAFLTGNISFLRARLGELSTLPGAEGTARDMDEALADLAEGARRIESIVRDLRGFTPGDEPDKPPTVELRRALEFAVRMAFNEVRHRARLLRDFEQAPAALGDEGRVVQVVVSLLVYAALAMPERSAEREPREPRDSRDSRDLDDNQVTLSARTEDGHAVIEVRNNGPALAPDRVAELFDGFVPGPPASPTTAAPAPNTLGLTISRNLAASMGGRLSVESTGSGTCFRLTLPLPQGSAPPRPRLLVVDDETLVGASIRRLVGHRAEVVLAEDAKTALRLCERQTFDALLCDVAMASVDRRRPLHAELVRLHPELVGRTGFIGGAPDADALTVGVSTAAGRVLDKPLRAEAVLALLEQLLA